MNFISKKFNNKMSLYFIQDNNENLKNYYKYTLGIEDPEFLCINLRVLFSKRLSELNILEKFKEFKVKFKQFKGQMSPQ